MLADGTWDALWETTDAVYDLALRNDGNLLVATGPEGRLYQVSTVAATWGAVSLVNTADAKQITRLAMDGARTLAVTANPGRVVAIGSTAAQRLRTCRRGATQTQRSGAPFAGRAGVVTCRALGNTGCQMTPGAMAAPTPQASGQAITSPAARFLQWKAALTPGTVPPVVTSVTVAYLARNLRPVVNEITIHPAGVVFQRPFSSEEGAIAGLDEAIADARRPPGGDAAAAGGATLGRRMFSRGLQTIGWKAEDPDADRLQFSLHYRREGEDTWRLLREQLHRHALRVDNTSFPDGRLHSFASPPLTHIHTPTAHDRRSRERRHRCGQHRRP